MALVLLRENWSGAHWVLSDNNYFVCLFVVRYVGRGELPGSLTKFSDIHTKGTSEGTSMSPVVKAILVTWLSRQHCQRTHDPAPTQLQPLFLNICSKQGKDKQQCPHQIYFSSQAND